MMKQSLAWNQLTLVSVIVCCALMLTGCATPQVGSLQQRWAETLPVSASIDVPFYPQDKYQCGPAALAMAATAAGTPLTPEQLVNQVYLPARQGSLQLEMLAAGRRYGLLTYRLKPDLHQLLQEVAAGNPVIVLQNLSFSFAPIWHYAVVVGFDQTNNTLILHSGQSKNMEMSLYTFERIWARAENWSMLVLPPGRIPVTATPIAYTSAVAALEHAAPVAAHKAYIAGLQKWPNDRTLMFGAGNTAYRLGQTDTAIQTYRQLTTQYPEFADGWNNLAQALLDQGKKNEAVDAIKHAVALGGTRLPRYLELQQQITINGAGTPLTSDGK